MREVVEPVEVVDEESYLVTTQGNTVLKKYIAYNLTFVSTMAHITTS